MSLQLSGFAGNALLVAETSHLAIHDGTESLTGEIPTFRQKQNALWRYGHQESM
jgi:hypothetical protein